MVFAVDLFVNGQSLLMVFSRLIVLAKVTASFPQIVVTCCNETVVFTINLFSNG